MLFGHRLALSKIKRNKGQKNLLDIAFDCGYYDHAHLSNEIKRYTGLAPSQF
ncbi:AraC family transcriptional regulator [Olivibacter sp. SDN3]|uniref:AraC family transcriptional regulator n=1 Tax=Olivibacter sp. SDN3 TaxID=2764720 RepID=UPI001650DE0D|nr:AraC family transcriptional regulator [Olivibacter sp. SDN3]